MELIGREPERGAVAEWLASRAPPVFLIEGEAGIGKSSLWRAGVEAGHEAGYRVLACTAAGAETQLSFTTIRDLLSDAFDEIADELPAPQRHALAVTLLREESRGPPPDPGAIAVAFLGALRALAAGSRVLVAVDDVQWVDEASAGPLAYVLRRLEQEDIGVLFARRSFEHGPRPLGLDDIEARIVGLGGLSIGALGKLLLDRIGSAYPRPTLHRLHQVSGGNPFYAVELGRALAGSIESLRPSDPLPVPRTLHELVRERLTALPPDTREVLDFAAALARPSLPLLDDALGRDAAPSLTVAVDAHVVDVGGPDVRFANPLYAAAVYDLAAPRRAGLHARLAEVVTDPEERARHVALATQLANAEVAQTIEEGAELAFARGSPAAAAELVAEARRLTPADDRAASLRRAVAEVDYEFAAGDTVRASAVLDEVLADAPAGPLRAGLLSRRARLRHFGDDIGRSVELLYEALAEVGDDDGLRGEIEEGLAWGLMLVRRDLGGAAAHAASAARLAEDRGDDPALAEALAAQAVTEFVLGRTWTETMDRALSLEDAMAGLRVLRRPSFAFGYCLSCSDELDRAREVFGELRERAEQAGDESSMPSLLNHLTLIECLAGHWSEAAEHAEDGYERALESGQYPTQVSIRAKGALLAARRGATDDARAGALGALTVAHAGFDAAEPAEAMARGGETAIWTLGFLELSLGNPDGAHRYLGPMVDVLLAAGVAEPGEVRCLPDELEALVELGRLDEAETLLELYEGWAARLARPSALADAGRCRGLLLTRRGDPDGALAVLEAAVARHEGVPKPFERARTLLALGAQQRMARQRRAARETLEFALSIFEDLGAELWAAKARSELDRIGGRAPSPGGLTPTEQRVAELVAQGKSNKEVAAALVVSVHTVEAALTSIYRKLDVHSRTEMAQKLAIAGD